MYNKSGKRIFDFVCALIAVALLLPLFVIISIFIMLDSEGPVFFLQDRIGKERRIFKLIKFRTMYKNDFQEKKKFTPGDISRITRFGSILRRTKIDELPQLINVLRGDMALVGPRPEVPKYTYLFIGDFESLLSLRPGITDRASIKYRNEEDLLHASSDPEKLYTREILPDKLRMSLEYRHNINFRNDVKIVFSTIMKIFK